MLDSEGQGRTTLESSLYVHISVCIAELGGGAWPFSSTSHLATLFVCTDGGVTRQCHISGELLSSLVFITHSTPL